MSYDIPFLKIWVAQECDQLNFHFPTIFAILFFNENNEQTLPKKIPQ